MNSINHNSSFARVCMDLALDPEMKSKVRL
jgi:hypothetical protein